MAQETRQLWFRAFALWLLLIGVEVLHGLWRTKVLAPWMGDDFAARQVCVFTGSLLILAITYVTIEWIPRRGTGTLLGVGAAWFGFTLVFDFCFGRFALHRSWQDIGSDFNILQGGMFPIGLAVLTFAPLIVTWLRRSLPAPAHPAGR
jgi:hypothetical protein